jgi:phosphoribosylformimino-5-aminoimidazole carboxamide ribotide isomerase
MRVIPVLDVMSGVTVRAVAGRRAEYRPLVSRLTQSTDPRIVAGAFRRHFGLTELYLADLDAIAGAQPNWALFADLRADGFRLWVDAGVRTGKDAARLIEAGIEIVVCGLETLSGPNELCNSIGTATPVRIAFSVDLRGGQMLGSAKWGPSPEMAAERAIEYGVRRMILLDLERVGVGSGTGTESLLARLTARFPAVEFVVGGGVGGRDDLLRLEQAGAAAVLIASALHDGRLTERDFCAERHFGPTQGFHTHVAD